MSVKMLNETGESRYEEMRKGHTIFKAVSFTARIFAAAKFRAWPPNGEEKKMTARGNKLTLRACNLAGIQKITVEICRTV